MPTKTTTKTAARKPSTARKAVKAAVVVEPKRKEPKSVKELPAKTSRTSAPASAKTRAAHPPPAPKAHAEPAPAHRRADGAEYFCERQPDRRARHRDTDLPEARFRF